MNPTQRALYKFKLVSDFHKSLGNKDNDDFGRKLTFLHFTNEQGMDITWKDLELIGALYDPSKND